MAITLITGAAGALGSAVAAHLAKEGHRVAAVDLPQAAERLSRLPDVLALPFDTGQPEAWAQALARVEKDLGPITGAALIAGGWQGGGPLHERGDDAIWRSLLAQNLDSAYRALRAVLPGMVGRGMGSVVAVGARAAVQPESSAGAAEYAATKAGLVALTQAVAAEVRERGVRLNTVLPSTLDTPGNRQAMPKADFSRWVPTLAVAQTIAFLLSDAAKEISGAALPIYGRS